MNIDFRKGSVPVGNNPRNDNGNSTMMLIALIFLIGIAMMGASLNAMMTEQRIIERNKHSADIAHFAGR